VETWSRRCRTYCERDTLVTRELSLRIRRAGVSPESVETEQELAEYLSAQQRNGVPFDMQRAIAFQGRLAARREELATLRQEFGSWYVAKKGVHTEEEQQEAMGYVAGADSARSSSSLHVQPGVKRHHIARTD
jgi:hypothetical protein